MPAAQSAVIFLPHPNSSDVFLFLRREEGGRAATVTQDVFLENCFSGRIRRVTSVPQCLYSRTRKCGVLHYTPLVWSTRTRAAQAWIDTHAWTDYETMGLWAQTCERPPTPPMYSSTTPRLKGTQRGTRRSQRTLQVLFVLNLFPSAVIFQSLCDLCVSICSRFASLCSCYVSLWPF